MKGRQPLNLITGSYLDQNCVVRESFYKICMPITYEYFITKCNICTNILCSLLIIAIESETVFANNKRCSGELFRLKPWFAHTKAICMQHCNDNAECNFYAYWSGGAGHGDCRGWTTCPSLENLSSAYKNTVYRVDRTTSGAIIINKFFNKRLCKLSAIYSLTACLYE